MRKNPKKRVGLKNLEGVVHPEVIRAMIEASDALSRAGIRHAVIGGLAVGIYGHPRATRDVDFVVGDEAFTHHAGGLVFLKEGIPVSVAGVAVDTLSIAQGEEFLELEISNRPSGADSIPVISIESLVYMKLKAGRRKDLADVVELLKGGRVPEGLTRQFLLSVAPDVVDDFDQAVEDSRRES